MVKEFTRKVGSVNGVEVDYESIGSVHGVGVD